MISSSFFRSVFFSLLCLSPLALADEESPSYYTGIGGLIGKNGDMDVYGGVIRLGQMYNPVVGIDYEIAFLASNGNLKGIPQTGDWLGSTVDATGKIITETIYNLTQVQARGNFRQFPMFINLRLQTDFDRFFFYGGVGVGLDFVRGSVTSTVTGTPKSATTINNTTGTPVTTVIDPTTLSKDAKTIGPSKYTLGTTTRFASQAFVGVGMHFDEWMASIGAKFMYIDAPRIPIAKSSASVNPIYYQMKKDTLLFEFSLSRKF